jgi:tRNA(Ile)-lysidine synthase
MDNSSKSRVKESATPLAASEPLEVAIADVLSEHSVTGPLAVALSGGPDSSAMAICAKQYCRRHDIELHLLHIHHGLQADADLWAEQVQQLGRHLGVPVTVERVAVDLRGGQGLEAAAREARHQALNRLALQKKLSGLLFAHHQQDQAETVLLRLLRGSGPTGLSAMQAANFSEGVWRLRPWLGQSRTDILRVVDAFTERTGWKAVDDPSNRDRALGRGAVREELAPLLQARWPAWAQTLARHAEQARQANDLLASYARDLIETVRAEDGCSLSLIAWRELDASRQALVLRTWLLDLGASMPTERRLSDLMRQLRGLHQMGHDRALKWQSGESEVTCARGLIQLHVRM